MDTADDTTTNNELQAFKLAVETKKDTEIGAFLVRMGENNVKKINGWFTQLAKTNEAPVREPADVTLQTAIDNLFGSLAKVAAPMLEDIFKDTSSPDMARSFKTALDKRDAREMRALLKQLPIDLVQKFNSNVADFVA